MPLFKINDNRLELAVPSNFKVEKELQSLIEKNLKTVFNCRFIASEFSTGPDHDGRIDTIALSEDGNPVIIEYKKVESSELVNQSLYYLAWIKDHKGDFQLAANARLGEKVEIDWSDIRVICIAPGYKKFDLHAVKMMGANIELWKYRLFEDGSLYIEEIHQKDSAPSIELNLENESANKKEVPVEYSFEGYFHNAEPAVKEIVNDLRELILGLSDSVEESPKKHYVAYKTSQNFVCIQKTKNKVTLYLKIDPKEMVPLPYNGRDVSNVGHYGTGDLELVLKSREDITEALKYIRKALENVGG